MEQDTPPAIPDTTIDESYSHCTDGHGEQYQRLLIFEAEEREDQDVELPKSSGMVSFPSAL
jgi:hypothetical protein